MFSEKELEIMEIIFTWIMRDKNTYILAPEGNSYTGIVLATISIKNKKSFDISSPLFCGANKKTLAQAKNYARDMLQGEL